MKELDTIILIKEFQNLHKGTAGCIVLKYDDNDDILIESEEISEEINNG